MGSRDASLAQDRRGFMGRLAGIFFFGSGLLSFASLPLAASDLDVDGTAVVCGIYLWRDRDAFEAFVAGELWTSVLDDESISEVDSRDFETMEELTASTQPGLKVV